MRNLVTTKINFKTTSFLLLLGILMITTSSVFAQNTGVGTDMPQKPLHVTSDNGDEILRLEDSNAGNTTDANPYLGLRGANTNLGYVGYGNTTNQHLSLVNYLNAPLSLHTSNTERFTIDGAGNVQIFSLAGVGNRMMIVDATGMLSSQAIPVNTDDQTIDLFSLTGTTLNLSLESDGQATQSVNLAGLQDGTGTDDQNLTGATLTGTSLQIDIEGGNSATVNLAALQDGTGTDDQNLTLTGNSLSIETGNSVDLSSITVTENDPQVGSNTTSFVPRWNGTALVSGLIQDNGSNVGINTAPDASVALKVGGNIWAAPNASDRRFKKDITNWETNATKTLTSLPVYTYQYDTESFPEENFSNEQQVGFIAQELKQLYPQAVFERADGYLGVNYGTLTPLLVKALQETNAEVDALKEMNEKMLSLTARLEARLDQVEAENATLKAEHSTKENRLTKD